MTSFPFEDLPPTGKALFAGIFNHDFWPAYPRKVGKKNALAAFKKACDRAPLDEILAGLERYKRYKPAYADWMHPATFLNGDRWEDEYDTLAEVKAGIHGGAWKGESLETIARTVIEYGHSWARYRYPRDVLEQCAAKGLLTDDKLAEALR